MKKYNSAFGSISSVFLQIYCRSYWSKQYQLKLQKKAKEVEEEIRRDQKMLKSLEEQLNQESKTKALAREIAMKEMELALKELQTQRQRELLRQKEYEFMFL